VSATSAEDPDELLLREPARLHVHPLPGDGRYPFLEDFAGLRSERSLTGRTIIISRFLDLVKSINTRLARPISSREQLTPVLRFYFTLPHFLRFSRRIKNGKARRYWSIVESKRCAGGRVVQRQVLYLGELNDSQQEAWCRVIEAFDEDKQSRWQIALFPHDRQLPQHAKDYRVQVRIDAMQLHRPRQWGAGQVFRREAGHGNETKPAAIPI
jgi:hypothetical protein